MVVEVDIGRAPLCQIIQIIFLAHHDPVSPTPNLSAILSHFQTIFPRCLSPASSSSSKPKIHTSGTDINALPKHASPLPHHTYELQPDMAPHPSITPPSSPLYDDHQHHFIEQYRQLISLTMTRRLLSPSLNTPAAPTQDYFASWETADRRTAREGVRRSIARLGVSWSEDSKYLSRYKWKS